MSSLAGKRCIVTGASSGIGEATARRLAKEGAEVVLVARREERLRALAGELGERASWVTADVSHEADVEALRDRVERLDVLVNNAGVPGGGAFAEVDLERLRLVADVNFFGVVRCTKLFLPLLERSGGHVVNVASIAGRYALPGAAVYSATKHAVVAFSESLYHELKPRGVMVTVINPGLVATEGFFPADSPLWKEPWLRPFIMRPERIARVIVDAIRRRRGPEISIPRWLAAPQTARILAPALYRAALGRIVGARARSAPAPRRGA
ncbi:MAG TPA: SDR family NAD(P)-dependent oxidoreductase [Actinomycetota bacterium]|nr:SDR family NAD(P)-dependent oxidoreductase [Actinomycetota bacterium]